MKQPFKVFRLNLLTILLTMFLIISCFANYFLSQDMQKNYENKIELTFNGNKFMNASDYLTHKVRAYVSTGDIIHYDNYWKEINIFKNRDVALAKMKELGITKNEMFIIEKMSKISNDLVPFEAKAMNDVKKGDFELARKYVYSKDYSNAISEINILKEEFFTSLHSRTDDAIAKIAVLQIAILQVVLCILAILIIILQVINYVKNKTMLSEFERLASVDVFSGLYNRNKYTQRIEELIVDKADVVGIVYLDINGLKQVNDDYGHEHGDKLILKVVDIIKSCFSDHLFRTGGDEFVVIFVDNNRNDFEEKVLKLRNIVTAQTDASVAIGSAWCTDVNDIFRQIAYADELMYVDKQNYYANCQLSRKKYRATIVTELHAAIAAGEFIIMLQPKIRLSDETMAGAEALVRKKDGKGSLLSPDKFIPMYESDGVIPALDFFVLESVCKLLKKWRDEGHSIPHVSVNFSRITILEYKVGKKINDICQKYDIESKLITIELTEHISNILFEDLNEILTEIKAFGFQISLDDFGREYANLSILSKIAFDEIKIDKSLIDDIAHNPATLAATRCIVEMCNVYRPTQMVVEGIETDAQVSKLRELNCELSVVQGYFFSKPIIVNDFFDQYIVNTN